MAPRTGIKESKMAIQTKKRTRNPTIKMTKTRTKTRVAMKAEAMMKTTQMKMATTTTKMKASLLTKWRRSPSPQMLKKEMVVKKPPIPKQVKPLVTQ